MLITGFCNRSGLIFFIGVVIYVLKLPGNEFLMKYIGFQSPDVSKEIKI